MRLIIFNFETNQDSQALGFAVDWINEFARCVDKLYVVSLRCGRYQVAHNVEVFCINQDKKSKIKTIIYIWKVLSQIHRKDKNIDGYFVHMAYYFVPIIYPFAIMYKQKIILWYAHKVIPFSLRLANFLVDVVVSSTLFGYQIKTKNLKVVGQGINTRKFRLKNIFNTKIKNIITVGRISKVKNTDIIVNAFILLNRQDLFLHIIGDIAVKADIEYFRYIKALIPKHLEKNIIFQGAVAFEKMPELYLSMDLAINLGDGALDKAILEPMAMGIPIITSNDSAKLIFNDLQDKGIYLLQDKKKLSLLLQEVIETNKKFDRKRLRKEIIENHSLDKLAQKIVRAF